MTLQAVEPMTEAEARRITERIRSALDRVATSWSDLAERVTEARERRADLALGYGSWEEYATAELRPSLGLSADIRRELVGMLTNAGMSPQAIAPVAGVDRSTISRDRSWSESQAVQVAHPLSEHIDPIAGEVIDPQAPVTVRDEAPALSLAVEHRDTGVAAPPAPRTVTGLDGKTYTRPKPKEKTMTTAAPPRLAIPQPPKYGGNRLKHNRIIDNTITSAQGLVLVLDEIAELDGSLNAEQAASYADDLSCIIRSLKRIQSLLQKAV